jgi:general secretion pathway protein D
MIPEASDEPIDRETNAARGKNAQLWLSRAAIARDRPLTRHNPLGRIPRLHAPLMGLLLAAGGCQKLPEPVLDALPSLPTGAVPQGIAGLRTNGQVGGTGGALPIQSSLGTTIDDAVAIQAPSARAPVGDLTLDFADTDIREVVAQILGTILKVNYTLDPAVHGSATLHTQRPFATAQLLPVLQALLAQNGAVLVHTDGLYRVLPVGGAHPLAPGGVGADATSGSIMASLRFASAEDLAKVLQPFVGNGGRILADPGRNALIIEGEPGTRETLMGLVRAFDTNVLAGQSYALLPVGAGGVKDFATALQDALRGQNSGTLAGLVRVLPMERVNAVLVVSSQPRYLDEARRVFALVERARAQTERTWHVIYLQNSHTNDVAYVLQRAFTPNDVSAQPDSDVGQAGAGQTAPGQGLQTSFSGPSTGSGPGGTSQSGSLSGNTPSGGSMGGPSGGIAGTAGGLALIGSAGGPTSHASANPLLGGLGPGAFANDPAADTMRIIPNVQNNAILVYATPREYGTLDAMIHKIDILPLQVRIDAVIAEVTLNDTLRYGTQFFFQSGGVNGVLSGANQNLSGSRISNAAFDTALPGLVVGGSGLGGAPVVLSALQAVTNVQVLSTPELMVLDNQPARLQVGNVVPYLSQTSQSIIAPNAPVVSSINYQQTGVIMQVTPRVNSGGLVTLNIAQEVSDVATDVTTPGINSPTFLQRSINSRVVVQDGQTIGLAGLIRDNATKRNGGIPWLKDVPLLGLLAGQQNNTRQRTELIVLITPHVMHDQRDARNLTNDLRDQLVNAAAVPGMLQGTSATGSADPSEHLRHQLRLQH